MNARACARREIIEANRGDFGPAELTASQEAAMPGEHVVVRVDQDRYVETKRRDAGGDLPDLLFAVVSRVARVGSQLRDPSVNNL
jgi:hypothetical protein